MSEKRFVCIDIGYGDDWYITDNGKRLSEMEIVDVLNEQQATIHSLKEEKDSLVAVIDENLLKGYHEQSIKHKEAKDKRKKGESSEVSPILDVIFYWRGYIKALEELKEGMTDEKKRFTCVLGKDYHIINNNVDNMTYYLQEGNDVVLVINLLNRLVEEKEQLKKENRVLKKDLNKLYNLLMDKGMSHNELQDVLW